MEEETSRTTATKVGLDDAERGSDRRERPQRADEPKTAEDEGDEGVATRRRRGTKDEGRRSGVRRIGSVLRSGSSYFSLVHEARTW